MTQSILSKLISNLIIKIKGNNPVIQIQEKDHISASPTILLQIHLVSITPNLSIFGTHSRISLLLMFFSFLCIFFLQLHHLDVSLNIFSSHFFLPTEFTRATYYNCTQTMRVTLGYIAQLIFATL